MKSVLYTAMTVAADGDVCKKSIEETKLMKVYEL